MRPPMLPRGRGQSRAPRELYPTAVLVGLISKETGHPHLDLGLLKTIGPTAAHSPPKSERVVYLLPQRGLLQLLQLCLLGRDTVLDCPIRVQLKDQHGSRLRVANPRIEVRTEVRRGIVQYVRPGEEPVTFARMDFHTFRWSVWQDQLDKCVAGLDAQESARM